MWGRLETSRDVQKCQDQQNSFLLSTSMACTEPRVCGWRKEDKKQKQASTRLYSRASYGWPWELQTRSGENCLGPSLYLLHWIDFLPRHESRFSVRPLSHQQWSLVVLEIRTLSNISMSRSWKKMESSNSKAVGLILARYSKTVVSHLPSSNWIPQTVEPTWVLPHGKSSLLASIAFVTQGSQDWDSWPFPIIT